MLYDPKWEQQTKADPFAIETLIAWLQKQSADVDYCYVDNGRCLLAQYFTAQGFRNVEVISGGEWFHSKPRVRMPADERFFRVAKGHPRTFGAALERARAAV